MPASPSTATLNLGMQTVTMAVFEGSGSGGITLRAFARTGLLADPAADANRGGLLTIALTELKTKLHWNTPRIACAIPSQGVFARFVTIPRTEEDKAGQILHMEAQQNVPYPIEDVAWSYQVLPERDEGKFGALILATKLDNLEMTVGAVRAAGMSPDPIEVSPTALYNAFRYNYPELRGCSLLIDIGARATNLIFVEDDRLFIRTLPVGGSTITTALQKRFEGRPFTEVEEFKTAHGFIPPPGNYAGAESYDVAEAGKTARTVMTRVHNEITRSITHYRTNQHGSAPMRVFLAGGGASLPYTLEFFNEKLSLPIEFFNPLRRIGVAPEVDSKALASSAHCLGECTGLAISELAGGSPLEIRLKSATLEKENTERRRRPFLVATAALLVATVVLAALYFHDAANHISRLNADLQARIAPLEATKAKLDAATREKNSLLKENADLVATPLLRRAWAALLQELNTQLPAENIWVTKLRPMVGEQVLEPGDKTAGWRQAGHTAKPAEDERPAVTALTVEGLYLENENGPAVVDHFVEKLATSPLFAITPENKAAVVDLRATQSGDAWAYSYRLVLPLARPIPLL